MRQSMTGFASVQGEGLGQRWTWELRGVNGKGLDLRLRLPDGIDGLEAAVRKATSDRLQRGNIQVSLRMQTAEDEGAARLDPVQMVAVLDALAEIEAAAMARGLSLAPSTASQIAGLRGVLRSDPPQADPDALSAALMADYIAALDAFVAMRTREGAALSVILSGQIDEIAGLTDAAEAELAARRDDQQARLTAQLSRVLDQGSDMDEGRIAQELALIAVKSDVTEEIDRLRAHVDAARALLTDRGAVGRKLDFLMQEFNREANTLCSKAGFASLTQIGLSLKTVIDQMREQVQNVE
ncbi:YicC family protein [Thalassococcus sp. CAU 1522]|uniref:YicC family protein n=2 Tax=Thalassococcus arenae TaxID=2851652 RepID=A0ABS6NA99_9RHOB|nr:YicC/YloC family endoribonuclease [Thalassococcus arenae]MBV2360952.1 YicC family protein [Thalassococcus arenae]